MKIKVMSFNLRTDTEKDGINYFPNRTERIRDVLTREKPDLIGFQEAREMARDFLNDCLGDDYVILGCGRKEGYVGEGCSLAYRKNLFSLIGYETKFLSPTPDIPASRYEDSDQSPCPRFYQHAQLIAKEQGTPFHFINTHLDHKGKIARVLEMKQLLGQISDLSGKVILTGDMNALPDSDCIALTKETLTDATASLSHTFHGYGHATPIKIDYIFTNGAPLDCYAVPDEPIHGVYISDHYPICAWIDA